MKYFFIPFLFSFNLLAQQITYSGFVYDAFTNEPLEGANLSLTSAPDIGAATNNIGYFSLNLPVLGESKILISFLGYYSQEITLSQSNSSNVKIYLKPKILTSQTVMIEAALGKSTTIPFTSSILNQKDIKKNHSIQDIPEFLSKLPSTTFYSENGNGVGYNYLSIRGFDQRRIAVSINGIPQNDPEDNNVYWIDFPDLLASTELIQVQRGAGSGVFGYPAIGGSINIVTSQFSNSSFLNFESAFGSYNTKKFSVSGSSGLIKNKYSIYTKLSQITSSGYRNLSWVKLNSFHFSAIRFDKYLTTHFNFYGGNVEDGLAYTGLPKFSISDKELRRANYSYWEAEGDNYSFTLDRRPEEIENFTQPHFELLNEFVLNNNVVFNSALFLVIGKGFFDYDASWADTNYFRLTFQNGFAAASNPSNSIIRAMVENKQWGWIPRIKIEHNNGVFYAGAEMRFHKSNHWGAINFAENLPPGVSTSYKYYFYNGSKDILSAFVHESYDLSEKINIIAELQSAYHKYKLFNEKFIGNDFSIDGLYFNPRVGVNYKYDEKYSAIFSFARVTREPRLKNYYDAAESSGGELPQFELNADGSYDYDKPLVQAETMNDLELGLNFNSESLSLALNIFFMNFENEIVKSGKLDRFGQPVTGNVDRTIHSGVELSLQYNLKNIFNFYLNSTYSQNKISDGYYFIDSESKINLSGNKISGFPDFLVNAGVNYRTNGLNIDVSLRYVGTFYSDYFDDNLDELIVSFPDFVAYTNNINDAYFTSDLYLSYEINLLDGLSNSKIYLQINNLFDSLYSANAIGGEFFPAAERNFLFGIRVGL